MSLALRIGIGALLIALAGLMLANPFEAQQYIGSRYLQFHSYLLSISSIFSFVPRRIVMDAPSLVVKGLALLTGGAGAVVLLNRKLLIFPFAYDDRGLLLHGHPRHAA